MARAAAPAITWHPYCQDGYRALVAAVLQQAVLDAREVHPSVRPTRDAGCTNADARDFLCDVRRVAFFVTLIGADPERVQPALLKAAGLAAEAGRSA